MASLLPIAASLCFQEFNETLHSTFSHIHYVQIIHNGSTKHSCEDSFLKQIELSAPVLLQHFSMELTYRSTQNFIIFYADDSDKTNDDLTFDIFRDLNKFPCYSNILLIHSNINFKTKSVDIIKTAWNEFVLNVTIMCTTMSNTTLSRNNMTSWLPTFRNQTLKIALFNYEPMVYYNKEQGLYEGVEKNILDQIITGWSVDYIQHLPNTWELIHSDIVNGSTDIGLCGFWRDSVNETLADMTGYYTQACNTFLVPKSRLIPLSYSYILQAFPTSLYVLVFILITFVSIIIKLIDPKNTNIYYEFFKLYQISLMMSSKLPKCGVKRLITGVWCLGSILMNVFFAAGLTRRLSFPRYSYPVNTFADMYKENVKWLLRSQSILPLINSSSDYYKQNLLSLLVGSATEGTDDNDIDYSQYAAPVNIFENFLDISADRIDTLAKQAKPLSECLSLNYFVFPIKKHSPIKRIFDNKLKQIIEAGLIQAWIKQHKNRNYKKLKHLPVFYESFLEIPKKRPLSIQHLQGAFYLLLLGLIIGFLAFLKEKFW